MTARAATPRPSFWIAYLLVLHVLDWGKTVYLGYTGQPVTESLLYWFAYGLGGNP